MYYVFTPHWSCSPPFQATLDLWYSPGSVGAAPCKWWLPDGLKRKSQWSRHRDQSHGCNAWDPESILTIWLHFSSTSCKRLLSQSPQYPSSVASNCRWDWCQMHYSSKARRGREQGGLSHNWSAWQGAFDYWLWKALPGHGQRHCVLGRSHSLDSGPKENHPASMRKTWSCRFWVPASSCPMN